MADERPIIIKRIVKAGGGGHHGGAWKVAYADFVTAMMAFFLLMWLLNATSEDQRKGLADYFDPALPISRTSAGGAGMLQGDDMLVREHAAGSVPVGERPRPTRLPEGPPSEGTDPADPPAAAGPPTPGSAFDEARKAEEARLARIGEEITQALAAEDGLTRHFRIRMTPEGLVIEIVDADDAPLFASGSAAPGPTLPRLIEVLAPVLALVTNPVAVIGHTDAKPFDRGGYGNWELSADRANTARRLLETGGLPADRLARVTGKAATEPLSDDPAAPQNRRIAITLLREVQR